MPCGVRQSLRRCNADFEHAGHIGVAEPHCLQRKHLCLPPWEFRDVVLFQRTHACHQVRFQWLGCVFHAGRSSSWCR